MEKDVKNDVVQDCETQNESPGAVKDEFGVFGLNENLNKGFARLVLKPRAKSKARLFHILWKVAT